MVLIDDEITAAVSRCLEAEYAAAGILNAGVHRPPEQLRAAVMDDRTPRRDPAGFGRAWLNRWVGSNGPLDISDVGS